MHWRGKKVDKSSKWYPEETFERLIVRSSTLVAAGLKLNIFCKIVAKTEVAARIVPERVWETSMSKNGTGSILHFLHFVLSYAVSCRLARCGLIAGPSEGLGRLGEFRGAVRVKQCDCIFSLKLLHSFGRAVGTFINDGKTVKVLSAYVKQNETSFVTFNALIEFVAGKWSPVTQSPKSEGLSS